MVSRFSIGQDAFARKHGDVMQINFTKLSTLTLIAAFAFGCSSKKEMDQAELNQIITAANAKAREVQPLPEMVRGIPLRPKASPTPITNQLKSNWCDYLDDEAEVELELREHFSSPQAVMAARQYVNALKGQVENCKLKNVSVSAFPLEVSEFDFGGNHFYLVASVDKNQKVSYMSLIPAANGLKIENKYIETADGLKLHTVVASFNDGVKRGTVFWKTPYFETSHLHYMVAGYDYFSTKGFNFILQSNRGAHLSEGDFKWLDQINIEDATETIDWITKQEFSNGKVMSYGVSYDGYNALAANVSNHPALKSVVACSAPANAATDSFSSNKSIEIHLLTYIAGREQVKQIVSNQEAGMALATADIHDWDNILYGRDLGDWDETIEAIKNIDSTYWEERSLIEGLKKSSIDTLHVAGLSFDQDSRDTLLAYQEVQNKGVTPENHRLFLHAQGHGCGGIEQSQVIDFYLSKITDTPVAQIGLPQVVQYSLANGSWISGDRYPLSEHIERKEFELSLEEGINSEFASSDSQVLATMLEQPTGDLGENNMAILAVEVKEDVYINGSIEIVLKATSQAPETRISAKLYYTIEDVQISQIQQYESGLARSSVVTTDDANDELGMVYPPRLLEIKAGTKIYVHLLTNDYSHIQALSPEREQYFMSSDQAKVSILDGAKLILPLEKVQSRELASN